MKGVAGMVDGGLYLFRPRLVHVDVVSFLTRITHQEDATQCLLHHPLKVATQKAINQENIHWPLMIGHKDIALMLIYEVASFDFDG